MATTTFQPYTGNGSNKTFNYSFPTYTASEVVVEVDGVVVDNYTIPGYQTTGTRTVTFDNSTGTVNTNVCESDGSPKNNLEVIVRRDTNVDNAKATFTAGSSLKAEDLTNSVTQILRSLQEEQNTPTTTPRIRDAAITTAKIKADNITSALIADDQIDSEHIVADSIDTEHYAPNSVDTTALAADAVTGAQIGDSQINSEHYVDGSIDRVHLAADIVDGTKIADDSINSEHYVDASIDEQHIANSAVTSNKIADNAITNTEILNGAVTNAKIADNSITAPKILNGSVGGIKIADLAVTTGKIAADAVDGTKIADNAVNSEHYVDASIDEVHLNDNIIGNAKLINGAVIEAKLGNDAVTTTKIQNDAVTIDKIADAAIVTNSEQSSHTVNDTTFFTTAAAEARYFNASTGETIKDGQSFPDNDTTIATTAAINDRIIDLVDDVGGFVPIANETSFPTTNPDVNNGFGTLISIKEISTTRTPNGSGTVSIGNGAGSGVTVTIAGCGSTVLTAGFGVIVESTTIQHIYNFHRLVPKATEVTTVASKATEIGRLGTADAVADMNTLGTAAIVEDMNLLGTTACVADMALLGDSAVIADMATIADTSNLISNIGTVAGIQGNVTTVAGIHGNVTTVAGIQGNVTTVAGIQGNVTTVAGIHGNVTTVANNNSNVTSVADNMANVNNFNDKYQIASSNPSTDGGGNALAAGDLYFNTSANELKVYTGSAWQGGVTATGNFASVTGNTFTGDNRYNDGVKGLFGTGSDLEIFHNGSASVIQSNNVDNLTLRQQYSGGYLFLHGDNAHLRSQTNNEQFFEGVYNGASSLFYDNVRELQTTANGVDINPTASGNGQIAIDGATGSTECIIFRRGGTEASRISHSNSANLVFSMGSSVLTKFILHSSGHVEIPNDNAKLLIGSSEDLQLYHNGSHSYIADLGTGDLRITGSAVHLQNAAQGENMLKTFENGAVELYYDNSKKFETLSTGAKFSGTLDCDDTSSIRLGTGADLRIYHNGSHSYIDDTGTGNLYIRNGTKNSIWCETDGTVKLYHNDAAKLETTATGVKFTGTLEALDNHGLLLGDSSDFRIRHTGSHSEITDEGTGSLRLGSNTTIIGDAAFAEYQARFIQNGAVELYHDNSLKLFTTAVGAQVTDNFSITDTGGNQRLLMGNRDSAGVDCPKILNSGNGTLKIGIGDSWSGDGGTLTEQFNITKDGHVQIPADNKYLQFGASQDLIMYHDGSHSYIANATGTLHIMGKSGENSIQAQPDGKVELYYDNSKKFETASTGTLTTGQSKADVDTALNHATAYNGQSFGFLVSYDGGHAPNSEGNGICFAQQYADPSVDNSTVRTGAIVGYKSAGSGGFGGGLLLKVQQAGANPLKVALKLDNAGNVLMPHDDSKLKIGLHDDLQIYHDGSNSHIAETGTGVLKISGSAGVYINKYDNAETMAAFLHDAEVQLYHNNNLKFETTSTGIKATHEVQFSSSTGNLRWPQHASGSTSRAWDIIGEQGAYGVLDIKYASARDTTPDEISARFTANDSVKLYYDSATKLETRTNGVTVTGSIITSSYGQLGYYSGLFGKIRVGADVYGNTIKVAGDNNMNLTANNSIAFNIGANADGSDAGSSIAVVVSDAFRPTTNGQKDLGATSYRWRNVYMNDLHLSNEGSSNDVDGTWGDWTMQEGESDLFLKNNRSGKKYKFNLTEVS